MKTKIKLFLIAVFIGTLALLLSMPSHAIKDYVKGIKEGEVNPTCNCPVQRDATCGCKWID